MHYFPSNYEGTSLTQIFQVIKNKGVSISEMLNDKADAEIDSRKIIGTSLHVAVYYQNKTMVEILLDAGADVDARDKVNSITLHIATYSNNKEIVKMLLNVGADVNVKDNAYKTSLDYANNNEWIEKLLGAKNK